MIVELILLAALMVSTLSHGSRRRRLSTAGKKRLSYHRGIAADAFAFVQAIASQLAPELSLTAGTLSAQLHGDARLQRMQWQLEVDDAACFIRVT